jgi:hypothetical protein
MDSCEKHSHEPGAAICGRCGGAWCGNCLVYAYGPKKPPLCLACAMYAGGVRSAATRPAMPRRELKARLKAAKAEAKTSPAPRAEAPAPVPAASPEQGDGDGSSWETPWWESSPAEEHTYAD